MVSAALALLLLSAPSGAEQATLNLRDVDGIEHRGAAHSRIQLLLHHPFQAQVVRAGEARAVDDGAVSEVSRRE